MKKTLIILAIIIGGIGILLVSDPFNTQLSEEDVSYFQAANLTPVADKDTLKVMTWNVKFGGGRIDFFFDCWGDRVVMTEEEVIQNLDGLAELIRATNPDILMLQEVDIDSKRSAYINQIQHLLDFTELNYAVYAAQWKADYIPSDGIGQINSGNVIMSKWPLKDAIRIGLPLYEEQNPIVRYFYLRRNVLKATTRIGDQEIALLCTHLAAYDVEKLRIKQLQILADTLWTLDRKGVPFIIGGDFNMLPPGTLHVKGFEDSICEEDGLIGDSYEGEDDWMMPMFAFQSEFDLADYQKDNSPYFSHTVNSEERGSFWNRKLDYLFANGGILPGTNITYQDTATGYHTMPLSDHCPVSVLYLVP